MTYLIFCSYEVGGLPYRFAEILNNNGIQTYYISIGKPAKNHDSTFFHYGAQAVKDWDLSHLFQKNISKESEVIKQLIDLKGALGIGRCFATGSRSFLLDRAGIPYVYWSYGADLDYLHSPWFVSSKDSLLRRIYYKFYWKVIFKIQMFKTFRSARKVMIAPYQKDGLSRVGVEKQFFFLPHVCPVAGDFDVIVKQKELSKKSLGDQFQADHFFFSSVRHIWSGKSCLTTDNKGNDILIKVLACFLKKTKPCKYKLVLVNKGPDVGSSKKLIAELGLQPHVIWVDEVKREDLNGYYYGATLCFGQFGTPVITNAVIEPLSCATPCVSYYGSRDGEVPYYAEFPPVFNSIDLEDISSFMMRVCEDKAFADELSYKSWAWVRDNCSEKVFTDNFVRSLDL